MFDLKRPCKTCPFRKGQTFFLRPERLEGIRRAMAFQCHATIDYDYWDDREKRSGDRPQQCAGLMAVLHRSGESNTIMQVAERLGKFDPAQLDPRKEAYASWAEVVAAHKE